MTKVSLIVLVSCVAMYHSLFSILKQFCAGNSAYETSSDSFSIIKEHEVNITEYPQCHMCSTSPFIQTPTVAHHTLDEIRNSTI